MKNFSSPKNSTSAPTVQQQYYYSVYAGGTGNSVVQDLVQLQKTVGIMFLKLLNTPSRKMEEKNRLAHRFPPLALVFWGF